MTKYDFGELALKLFGLYWLFQGFLNLLTLILLPFQPQDFGESWNIYFIIQYALFTLWYGIAGFLLIKRYDYFLKIISITKESPSNSDYEARKQDWEAFSVALLALLLVMEGIKDLVWAGAHLSKALSITKWSYSLDHSIYLPRIIEAVIKFGVAAAMFFGRDTIVFIWRHLRAFGTKIHEMRG
ncbi:MAG TPA: hypothetical protein PK747_09310 [Acidobacteriota bacterium]|nr:hypothetical protein [Acidobacteriota bacterium]HQO20593.1 hypothetical protein [Acidobacteriota bacterium]HQQ47590.1 hypothetical protein [Acidobacteriota bacterium]